MAGKRRKYPDTTLQDITELQSARTTALLSAVGQLNQIADNFESWAKKERARYTAFSWAQVEDWVNTYLSKQRLIAVFFNHPHLSYDIDSGLLPFLTTEHTEHKEFHLIIDVFRLHKPAIATSLKELYDDFWGDVGHHIECHKRSKKVRQENIPSIGESMENTFWIPPLFLDGAVASLVRRLRHIAEIVKEELAPKKPEEEDPKSLYKDRKLGRQIDPDRDKEAKKIMESYNKGGKTWQEVAKEAGLKGRNPGQAAQQKVRRYKERQKNIKNIKNTSK